MQASKISFPEDIYSAHLETVNNIRFTRREVDIIAYLFSGRSAKTISSFLSVAPKTIESHMRNIMLKLECNSRDGVIDFIEKSDKFSFIKKYYLSLLVQASFEKQLAAIAKQCGSNSPTCLLIHWDEQDHTPFSFRCLESHLERAGIKLLSEVCTDTGYSWTQDPFWREKEEKGDRVLCLLPQKLLGVEGEHDKTNQDAIFRCLKKFSEHPNYTFALFLHSETERHAYSRLKDSKVINFFDCGNYYLFVFELLKQLLPGIGFEEKIQEFKDLCRTIYESPEAKSQPFEKPTAASEGSSLFSSLTGHGSLLLQKVMHNKKSALLGFIVCFFIFMSFFVVNGGKITLSQSKILQGEMVVRPDLVVPTGSVFLDRPELMQQIGESFKGKNEIQITALIGIGGAGKTTLARHYARQKVMNLVWEINAETQESLKDSFENLADALSQTEEERKKLRALKDIKIDKEREHKIMSFVKDKLKRISDWFLIYDNVGKISDIQPYFPHDFRAWGRGNVIIVTRDNNIKNNNIVNETVQIGELSPEEKLGLFAKIMANGNCPEFTSVQTEQAKKFLQDIPPFPLDVSIAAYYLKATNIPYKTYLEKLMLYDRDFESVQQILLEEASAYTKTRYGIITLSLQHIINSHKDFPDLLLFISLLDSQNIPRDLLETFKANTVVDNFIYNLKKHSFVTNEAVLFSGSTPAFAIHRSTQAIALAYLTKVLNLEKDKKIIEHIGKTLKNYVAEVVDKEDFTKMNIVIRHCEMFLGHSNILTDFIIASIGSELGSVYRELGNYEKAKSLFEQGIVIYKRNFHENPFWFAQNLGHLGCVYSEQGNYEKAKQLLEESLVIYRKNSYENNPWFARTLGWLGNVYREQGNYKKAKQLFEESLIVYKKNSYGNHPWFAQALGRLGSIYREQCDYEKAKQLLEESLVIYRKNSYENNPWFARALAWLGSVYRDLGNYEQAKQLLEESLVIYRKNSHENHPWFAWTLVWLGSLYKEQGNHEKAKQALEESLVIYRKNSYENHPWFARALAGLGSVYREQGNYEKAKHFFEESLVIYRKNSYENHPWFARTLEHLGNIYRDQGNYAQAKKSFEETIGIYEKNHFENHPWFALVLARLGSVYRDLGNYAKAKELLERSFQTYEKTCGKDHVDVAPVIMNLGKIYMLEHDMKTAETLINKALDIFRIKKQAESYVCLEGLSDLYLKKEAQLISKGDRQESVAFKKQAIDYLKQALEVIKTHFPKNSPHIARIEDKIRKLTS